MTARDLWERAQNYQPQADSRPLALEKEATVWPSDLDTGVRLGPVRRTGIFTSLKRDLGIGNYTLLVFEPLKTRFKRVTLLKSQKTLQKTKRVKG